MRLRTESRREAILAVASDLFREAGFERASMAQIAERVGGSKATLYGYFPSKEALFVAVANAASDQHLEQIVAEISDTSGDLEAALNRFGVRLVAFLSDDSALAAHRMVLAEAGRSDVGELFWNAGPGLGQKLLAEFLAVRMQQGELRTEDPMLAASHLLALLNAENGRRMFSRTNPPLSSDLLQRTVHRAVAAFLRGYRSEPSTLIPSSTASVASGRSA